MTRSTRPVDEPRLRALVEAERPVPPVSAEARARLLARVQATVASPPVAAVPVGTAASGATLGAKLTLILGGLTTVVVVALAVPRATRDEPAAVAVSARPIARLDVSGPAASAPRLEPSALATAPKTPEEVAPPVTAPPATAPPAAGPSPDPAEEKRPPARDPLAERAILERAQAAVARADHAGALAATREHTRRYPRGALVEEREVLRVRALLGAGDHAGARAAADAFRARFPRSIHGAAIDALAPP